MERVKRVNIAGVKSERKSVVIEMYYKLIIALGMATVLVFAINYISYSSLANVAKVNYELETELVALKNENSLLEGIKAESLNMREIENKAIELGFMYNNNINYIK
ncbi:hypothetical protein [Oceanivirga salmonicida]|uniref:hypothetical protein n=1 Tax=Oceanivirga salmonicida TaxID=1769291 RepID=UPI00082C9D2A|nr:hypothetical protein [Oceanivirga salmonicida]